MLRSETHALTPLRVFIAACLMLSVAGAAPDLRIVTPKSGSVVRPGETVTVQVSSHHRRFRAVLLVFGDQYAGLVDPLSGKPPWQLQLEIPANAEPGRADLMAVGVVNSEDDVESPPIELDIEPVALPRLELSIVRQTLGVNQCISLDTGGGASCGTTVSITGVYPDGRRVPFNRSTLLTFVSLDPSIARIFPRGGIVAVSPGSTRIVVSDKYFIDVTVTK